MSGYFVPVVVVLGFIVFCMWLVLTHLDCFPHEMYPPGSNGLLVSLLFAISVIVIGTTLAQAARHTSHTQHTAVEFHAYSCRQFFRSVSVCAGPGDAHGDHGGHRSRCAEWSAH